jgi:hypothetical protein
MDAPPVHLSEPLSVDVLPAPTTTRRTPFRRSRNNHPVVLDRPIVVAEPDAETHPDIGSKPVVVTDSLVVTGPAAGTGPVEHDRPPEATHLLRERDEARARVADLERQLELLNREVAFVKDEPSLVWVARGDSCYHRRRRCAGLVAQPAAVGGTSLQLAHVPRAQALDSGLHRCQLCC